MEDLKPCPFCGAKIEPVICHIEDNPRYWANGLWFLNNTHEDYCIFKYSDLFGDNHFGKAIDGEPTKLLIEWGLRWNRRTNDV